MTQRVRIADRFKSQSAEQLVTMAGTVITGLTNNSAFPAPTVDLKAVQAAADSLNEALAAQPHGGAAATAESSHPELFRGKTVQDADGAPESADSA